MVSRSAGGICLGNDNQLRGDETRQDDVVRPGDHRIVVAQKGNNQNAKNQRRGDIDSMSRFSLKVRFSVRQQPPDSWILW